MRAICLVAAISVAILTTCGGSAAWAIAGGGLAPGGPLSGSVRPSCNGYNMDGTVNTSPGADRPGCVDQSVRAIRRPAVADPPAYR